MHMNKTKIYTVCKNKMIVSTAPFINQQYLKRIHGQSLSFDTNVQLSPTFRRIPKNSASVSHI